MAQHVCRNVWKPADETTFRFVFGHREDSNREITLSILLFPMPAPEAAAAD
jgi:hypothetical protein